LRYVDEIWFAHRLLPSEGSNINKCETGNITASIWTSYRFIKMAGKYYFRFRICWYRCLQKVKVYQQIKFRPHISIDGWGITTSVFEKQTSAILEIYFRFRFRPFARNLHIILYQATELCPNQSTHCGNMTSYPFLKMAAATVEYYFRFRICWCHCLQKVKVYLSICKPNFVEISQMQAEIYFLWQSKMAWEVVKSGHRHRYRPPRWPAATVPHQHCGVRGS